MWSWVISWVTWPTTHFSSIMTKSLGMQEEHSCKSKYLLRELFKIHLPHFVFYFKITNIFLKINTCILHQIVQGTDTWIWNLSRPNSFKFWIKTVKMLFSSISKPRTAWSKRCRYSWETAQNMLNYGQGCNSPLMTELVTTFAKD